MLKPLRSRQSRVASRSSCRSGEGDAVKTFLSDADKGQQKERAVAGRAACYPRQKTNAVFESRDGQIKSYCSSKLRKEK